MAGTIKVDTTVDTHTHTHLHVNHLSLPTTCTNSYGNSKLVGKYYNTH